MASIQYSFSDQLGSIETVRNDPASLAKEGSKRGPKIDSRKLLKLKKKTKKGKKKKHTGDEVESLQQQIKLINIDNHQAPSELFVSSEDTDELQEIYQNATCNSGKLSGVSDRDNLRDEKERKIDYRLRVTSSLPRFYSDRSTNKQAVKSSSLPAENANLSGPNSSCPSSNSNSSASPFSSPPSSASASPAGSPSPQLGLSLSLPSPFPSSSAPDVLKLLDPELLELAACLPSPKGLDDARCAAPDPERMQRHPLRPEEGLGGFRSLALEEAGGFRSLAVSAGPRLETPRARPAAEGEGKLPHLPRLALNKIHKSIDPMPSPGRPDVLKCPPSLVSPRSAFVQTSPRTPGRPGSACVLCSPRSDRLWPMHHKHSPHSPSGSSPRLSMSGGFHPVGHSEGNTSPLPSASFFPLHSPQSHTPSQTPSLFSSSFKPAPGHQLMQQHNAEQ